jgi:hypothetical protein
MKKMLLTTLALAAIVVILACSNFSAVSPVNLVEAEEDSKVITVANSENADENKVLESRFLNMLNHNFVYNEAFETTDGVVNNSVIALLEFAEDGYIAENYVSDYILNMYGIEGIDYSQINPEFDYIEGYVFVLPMGYSSYNHEIKSVTLNEDGSYTVKTLVEISSHDSGAYFEECESLFVKNEASQFGFSIIYSDLGAASVAI